MFVIYTQHTPIMMFQATRSDEYIKVLAWLFTLSFILITFLPRSIDDTMFMDGVTYASIARNMSMGIGSFWRPFFAHSFWLPYDNNGFFSGHPPLQFGIQAIMFYLIGDSIAVENIYNLIILASSIIMIIEIWGLLLSDKPDLRRFAWLPVLCWYAMVTVWYSIPNNFLDSTMAVFCLLSCYFQLLFFKKLPESRNSYIVPVLAGLCIVLGFLTKGPVSLFPLVFPLIYAFCNNKKLIQTAGICIAIMIGVIVASFITILIYQPAYHFMSTYFQGQVVQALLQKREKTGEGLTGHFFLLFELLRNVYPHLLALVMLHTVAWLWGMKTSISQELKRVSVLSLLVTASATLPLLISIKQYPHYLLPALPFAALLFAALFVEKVATLFSLHQKWVLAGLIVGSVACWALMMSKVNNIKPSVMAANAIKIKSFVDRSSTIAVCHELFQNADIHANFQRYHFLSLTTDTNASKFVFADSSCIALFNSKTDSIIPLQSNYLLVIKNVHQQPLVRQHIRITSPGG
jgi:hypothetical protein